jgi:predicted nucleic acid-binding protein
MIAFIDTSVLVAAVVSTEAFHEECDVLLDGVGLGMFSHGLAETFSTLTGGRRSFQMPAPLATHLLEEDYLPCLTLTSLTPSEMLRAMRDAEFRGVRGGAIFDYLHLVAARKAKATKLYTLNVSNFRAFHRTGDPEIVHP